MPDPFDLRIEQANTAIRRFIQALPGGRITTTDRPEYEQLVEDYFQAVRDRDEARREEPGVLAA